MKIYYINTDDIKAANPPACDEAVLHQLAHDYLENWSFWELKDVNRFEEILLDRLVYGDYEPGDWERAVRSVYEFVTWLRRYMEHNNIGGVLMARPR